MIQIDENLTRNVAHLARLELTDDEVSLFTAQLGQVIGYVDLLQEVRLGSDVEPLTHPLALETPMRDDVVRPSPVDSEGQPKSLSPAPDVLDGGFKVPPIV